MTRLQARLIEQETQNAELRAVQHELDEARQFYSSVYDGAPVGLLTLDHNGVVLQANATAGEQLGMERRRLIRRPFIMFVPRDYLNIFRGHCREAIVTRQHVVGELVLKPARGEPFRAWLDTLGARHQETGDLVCHAAVCRLGEARTESEPEPEVESKPASSDAGHARQVGALQKLLIDKTRRVLELERALAEARAPAAGEGLSAADFRTIHNALGGIHNVVMLLKTAIAPEHEYAAYLPLLDQEFERVGDILRRVTEREP